MGYNKKENIDLNVNLLSNKRFEKISDEIYICKNFLTEEECDYLVEESLKGHNPKDNKYYVDSFMQYRNRLLELLDFNSQDNIKPEDINRDWDHLILRTFSQDDNREFIFPPHVDIYNLFNNYSESASFKEFEGSEKISIGHMSFVIYFSENFLGGEIYYPEYNVKYKPKKGDMILHNVEIIHAVHNIVKGDRWSYQGSISTSKFLTKEENEKFLKDNIYYGECRNKNDIDHNPDFYYRADQKPIFNKRLISYVNSINAEPYL